jgi:hypothetical protein
MYALLVVTMTQGLIMSVVDPKSRLYRRAFSIVQVLVAFIFLLLILMIASHEY